jgi:NitT/TauT family transport system substrate-binding protein
VAWAYKQLWTVEEIFRTMKSLLEARPIWHHLDETIRGHVFCSFLALRLRFELESRLAERGECFEWASILRDLEEVTEIEVEKHGTRFVLRSEAAGFRRQDLSRLPAPPCLHDPEGELRDPAGPQLELMVPRRKHTCVTSAGSEGYDWAVSKLVLGRCSCAIPLALLLPIEYHPLTVAFTVAGYGRRQRAEVPKRIGAQIDSMPEGRIMRFPNLTQGTLLCFTVCALSCGGTQQAPEPAAKVVARCTHSVGLCNLPLFIAAEDHQGPGGNLRIELTSVPDWGKHALALQKGDVEFSVTPFTTVMLAYAAGVPLRVISGSGMNGLRLVAAKDITEASGLRGKRIGTFKADTLEMMLYTYLKRNGLSYSDVEIVYYDDGFQLVTAFESGKVDAMTHVEPYATRATNSRDSHILATGEGNETWGQDHPDCVLVTTASLLRDEPEKAKAMIRAMIAAERKINSAPDEAARRAASKYYRAKVEDVVFAARTQRPLIDIRSSEDFMEARFKDLKALGHIPSDARFEGLLALGALTEVLQEQAQLQE